MHLRMDLNEFSILWINFIFSTFSIFIKHALIHFFLFIQIIGFKHTPISAILFQTNIPTVDVSCWTLAMICCMLAYLRSGRPVKCYYELLFKSNGIKHQRLKPFNIVPVSSSHSSIVIVVSIVLISFHPSWLYPFTIVNACPGHNIHIKQLSHLVFENIHSIFFEQH